MNETWWSGRSPTPASGMRRACTPSACRSVPWLPCFHRRFDSTEPREGSHRISDSQPRVRRMCCSRCSTRERGLSPPPTKDGRVVGVVQQSPTSKRFDMYECSSPPHTSHAVEGVLIDLSCSPFIASYCCAVLWHQALFGLFHWGPGRSWFHLSN